MNLKYKMLKYSVMWLHHSLVQNGKYVEARVVLQLLRRKQVTLILTDTNFEVARLLDELGCRTFYPRHIIALVYLEVKT